MGRLALGGCRGAGGGEVRGVVGFTGGPARFWLPWRGLTGRVERQVRGTTPWRERSRRMQSACSLGLVNCIFFSMSLISAG